MRNRSQQNQNREQYFSTSRAEEKFEGPDVLVKSILTNTKMSLNKIKTIKISGVEVIYEGNKYSIVIYLSDTEAMSKLLRKNIEGSINKKINQVMKNIQIQVNQTLNYYWKIKDLKENYAYEKIAPDVLEQLIKNIGPIIRSNILIYQNGLEEYNGLAALPYDNQLIWIRTQLELFIGNILKVNCPALYEKNKVAFLRNSIFLDWHKIVMSSLDRINGRMSNLMKTLTERVKQYVYLVTDQEIIFNWKDLIKEIEESQKSFFEKSCQFLLIKTFLEDYADESSSLLPDMENQLNQLQAILKCHESIKNIFIGFSPEDVTRILAADQLFFKFNIDWVIDDIKDSQINIKYLQENILSADISIVVLEKKNLMAELKTDKENKNKRREPWQKEGIESEKNDLNEVSNSIEPVDSEGLSISNNHSLLFVSPSVTQQYKSDARDKIQKEQNKELQRKQRKNNHSNSIFFSLPKEENQTEEETNKCILYILSNGKTIKSDMFLLAGNFIYLCCDMQWVKGPKEKLEAFQKTALLGKVLTRGSLGVSGIKIYGSHFLIVKCKAFPREHLLCCPHSLPGTNKIVYVPMNIISHQKYEEYLKDRNLLIQHLTKQKDLIKVSETVLKQEKLFFRK